MLPLPDQLGAAGVPYGAVSNNVHEYQRAKLDGAGLDRVMRLVGTDTVGVAKPEPAIYLEGVRLLGTVPEETLYVGDNRMLDAERFDGGRPGGRLARQGGGAGTGFCRSQDHLAVAAAG